MKRTPTPATLILAALLLASCNRQSPQPADQAPQAPEASRGPTAAPSAPVVVQHDPRSKVATNHLDMYVADGRVQNWQGIGSRNGDKLTSNATNGYLMFGPKVSFDAGKYKVTVHGEDLHIAAGNSITFDAVSDEGKQVHAKHVLDAATGTEAGMPLAEFTFSLPEAVSDLEIRAYVTSGSQVALTRYEVAPASP